MAKLIIRNKNRALYSLKSKIRKYCRRNEIIFNGYLKLKEFFIGKETAYQHEGRLFDKIYIETISYCNNDCSFCMSSTKIGIKRAIDFMAEDLYVKILMELKGISFTGSIAFHCNNEPLLDKRLTLWIKRARSLLKANFFYLYTNGILLNMKLANDLFEAGLNRIIVNNYDDNFKLLPSMRNILDNSKYLKGELVLNYRLKKEFLPNRAGQNPDAGFFLKTPLNIMCQRPSKEIVIGYDGTVPLCCADTKWKLVMGNVREESIKDIWFSDFFKKARSSLVNGDRASQEICGVCDALNFPAPRGIRE